MPRVKQFDQEEVLQKAMLLFWKQGYHDTSIDELVKFLGINRASLYDTFGGKKKLYEKALESYRTQNYQGMHAFLQSQENVKEGLRQVFQKITYDDYADEDCKGCFIVNTTTELLPADSDLQAVIEQHGQLVEQAFVDFLQKGVERGQISKDKDLKTLASLLYTLMTGLRVVGKTKPEVAVSMAAVDAVLSLLEG